MGFKKILIASLLPFILYTVFALLFSGICYFSKDPTKGLGLYSLISLVLSGSISGFINSKTGNGKSMFLTVISTTIISFIMLLV